MNNNSPVYWKMRNGKLINVDDMDNNHVRNAFKMLLRNLHKLAEQKNSKLATKFTLKGDIANEFHDTYLSDEDNEYDHRDHFYLDFD